MSLTLMLICPAFLFAQVFEVVEQALVEEEVVVQDFAAAEDPFAAPVEAPADNGDAGEDAPAAAGDEKAPVAAAAAEAVKA
ncbi:MAG: hypothetical protein KDB27_17765, partial [Planctomycetales bacterium]|nr:hypothetical protein [Planctomycetales bacterium]